MRRRGPDGYPTNLWAAIPEVRCRSRVASAPRERDLHPPWGVAQRQHDLAAGEPEVVLTGFAAEMHLDLGRDCLRRLFAIDPVHPDLQFPGRGDLPGLRRRAERRAPER